MSGNTTVFHGDRQRTVRPFVLGLALIVTVLPLPGSTLRFVRNTQHGRRTSHAPGARARPRSPALPQGYSLSGSVKDTTQIPVPNATVHAILTRNGKTYPLGTTHTDSAGAFSLSHLPAGDYWLAVNATGKARVIRTLRVPEMAQSVTIVMEPGAAISGVVTALRRGQTEALGGVVLRALREGTTLTEDPGVAVRSDSLGRFTLDGLSAGSFRVEIDTSGFEPLRRVGVSAPSEGLALTVRAMASLEGQVVDRYGEPARGARVTLSGSGVWPPRALTVLDDGGFRVPSLPGGVYELRAMRDDDQAEPLAPLMLDPGESATVRLALRPGAVLSGVVLDAQTRSPLRGARVVVTEDALSMVPRAVSTDAQGRWSVRGLLARSHQMAVRAEGYASRTGVAVRPGGAVVEVGLDRAARIEGRVFDTHSRPVQHARVDVSVLDLDGRVTVLSGASAAFRNALFEAQSRGPAPLRPAGELGVMPGRIPIVPVEPAMQGFDIDDLAVGFATDADGRFVVTDVPPGTVRVAVSHPRYVRAEIVPRQVQPGESITVDLALHEGGTIEGRAVTERGFPLRALSLEVRVGNEPAPRRIFTQQDGTFVITAVEGRVSIVAMLSARPAARAEVTVADGETSRVTLTVNASLRRAEGRVVDRRGFPVAGATVHLTTASRGELGTATTLTESDGTFDTLIAGAHAVSFEVRHSDFAPRTVRVEDLSRPVRIELASGAGLSFELRDDGCATGTRRIEVRTVCGPVVLTSAEREVSLEHLCAGRAMVLVDAEGCVRSARTVTLGTQGTTRISRIELVGGGGVEGTVVDARRDPVAGAIVRRRDAADDDPTGVARTDRQGRFVLSALPEGDVPLVAVHPALGQSPATVVRVLRGTVARGREVRFSLSMGERTEASDGPSITVVERRTDEGVTVVIERVRSGSTAESAGLRPGDTVRALGGNPIGSAREFSLGLDGARGDLVVIDVEREGVRRTVRFARER